MNKEEIIKEIKKIQKTYKEQFEQFQKIQNELNQRKTNIVKLEGIISYLQSKITEEKVEEIKKEK